MIEEDLVSVIIPAYNASDYLQISIDSVLSQTYQNIELIVINDGSLDDNKTDEIARSYGDRIKYIYQENGGVSAALNTGIRNSSGKWVAWLSHDDYFDSKKIEIQVSILKNNPEFDVCYSNYNVVDKNGKYQGFMNLPYYEPKVFTIHLIQAMFVCGSTVLINKKCFNDMGLFDEKLRYAQDADFWIRLSTKFNFIHCSEKLVNWRFHANQGSRNFKEMKKDKKKYLLNVINKISINDFFIGQNEIENFESRANQRLAFIMLKCHREPEIANVLFLKSFRLWRSFKNRSLYFIVYLNTFGFIYYKSATFFAHQIRKISRKNLNIPVVDFNNASNKVNIIL